MTAPDREREVAVRSAVEGAFRRDHGRILGTLVRDLGSLDVAEEALQDAVAEALRTWPARGAPDRPAAWLLTLARSRGIDRLRRRAVGRRKVAEAADPRPTPASEDPVVARLLEDEGVPDERLRLLFAACHPAIARRDAVALALRTVTGLRTEEVAGAFLVSVSTMQARLTRARARIRDAGIPFRVPDAHELPERLPPVLDVVLLVHRQGLVPIGDDAVVAPLRREAAELSGLLAAQLPDEPEALALHALLLLSAVREPTRLDGDGEIVVLRDADRSRWRHELVVDAEALLDRAMRQGRPGPLQVQAAIAAVHTTAPTWEETDWPQLVVLHDLLATLDPSPTVAVARALAVGMAEGPDAGLDALPASTGPVADFHRWHAVRAELLEQAGHVAEAAVEWATAAELATNAAERRWLRRRATATRGPRP